MSKMSEIERTPLGEERQGEVMLREGLGQGKKLYLESYGCQMNFSDSEIVASSRTLRKAARRAEYS